MSFDIIASLKWIALALVHLLQYILTWLEGLLK
jgi:hypothetical protein